jgi:hypothetical protein
MILIVSFYLLTLKDILEYLFILLNFFRSYKSFIFWPFDFKRCIGIFFDHLNFKKGDHSPNCIAILIITISAYLLSYIALAILPHFILCFDYLESLSILKSLGWRQAINICSHELLFNSFRSAATLGTNTLSLWYVYVDLLLRQVKSHYLDQLTISIRIS